MELIAVRYNAISASQEEELIAFLQQLTQKFPESSLETYVSNIRAATPPFLSDTALQQLDDQQSLFYQYLVYLIYCLQHNVTRDLLESELIEQNLTYFTQGYLELSSFDYDEFKIKLGENVGSKEQIKYLRRWIIERAHSAHAIGMIIVDFVLHLSPTDLTDNHVQPFDRILHMLYVINDIFFHLQSLSISPSNSMERYCVPVLGPYTTILTLPSWFDRHSIPSINIIEVLYRYIIPIAEKAYDLAQSDAQREKLTRLISLWESKQFLQPTKIRSILTAMTKPRDLRNSCNPYQIYSVSAQVPLIAPYISQQLLTKFERYPDPKRRKIVDSSQSSEILAMLPSTLRPQSTIDGKRMEEQSEVEQEKIPARAQLVVPILKFDMTKVTVGSMTNITKAALKIGAPKYAPVDLATIAAHVSSLVEKGRIDARTDEFYRGLVEVTRKNSTTRNNHTGSFSCEGIQRVVTQNSKSLLGYSNSDSRKRFENNSTSSYSNSSSKYRKIENGEKGYYRDRDDQYAESRNAKYPRYN